MRLKKDLSFTSLRFTPFLGLHSLHGAQLVGAQKPTGFQLVHVIELSIYMAPNSIGAFLFNTVRENRNPGAMSIDFKSIQNMVL